MRLRQLLGEHDAVTYADGIVGIDPRYVWVDAWAFEEWSDDSPDRARLQHWLALYRGPFLADEADAWWAAGMRLKLERRFRELATQLAKSYGDEGDWQRAAECYAAALEVDETAEDLCHGLMSALDRLERPTEALVAYRRLREALARQGAKPSPVLQALSTSLGGR